MTNPTLRADFEEKFPGPILFKEQILTFIEQRVEAARQEEAGLWRLAIVHCDTATRNRIIAVHDELVASHPQQHD